MGLLDWLGGKPQQPQTQPSQIDYSKHKLGGILGAVAAGLSPQAYADGRNMYETRTIGGIQDPNEQLRAAQQMGRYDLVDQLQKMQEARAKAGLNSALARINPYGAQSAPRPNIAPPVTTQAPIAQNQVITPQMEAEAAQSMPMVGFENQQQQLPDGSTLVNVQGQKQQHIPAPQFQQKQNPYEVADYYDQLAREAYNYGGQYGFEAGMQYKQLADKARQDAMGQFNQGVAANLAPALMVKDNPDTPNYNEADAAFNQAMDMMPYALPAEWQRLLSDPQTRRQAAQMLINMGNPKEAANTAIDVQGSYDQFRPYQNVNLGDRYGVFNPASGKIDIPRDENGKILSDYRVGLNPTQVRGQNISRQNSIDSNATSRENNRNSVGLGYANLKEKKRQNDYNQSIGAPMGSEANFDPTQLMPDY